MERVIKFQYDSSAKHRLRGYDLVDTLTLCCGKCQRNEIRTKDLEMLCSIVNLGNLFLH